MSIKVMTYNIQHGIDYLEAKKRREAHKKEMESMTEAERKAFIDQLRRRPEDPSLIRLDKMAQVIKAAKAEIVAVNEVRDESPYPCFFPEAKMLSDMTELPYYYFGKALDIGGHGPYGNALLSKYPILSAETIAIPDPEMKEEDVYYETRCLIKAVIAVPADPSFESASASIPLTVLVTHMGLAKAEARNAVATVLANTDPSVPTIAMGDFNLAPDSEILTPLWDVYHDAGALLPSGTCSFPSDAPNIKIDYVLATGAVQFRSAEVLPIICSDHRPHVAEIEI